LFNALVIGTGVMHLNSKFHGLQQTVALFIIGMAFSLVVELFDLQEDLGVFGASYGMWLSIDPHLMLGTLLPALLAGDAMTIDTTVARRVGYQCLWLAGPGVVIQACLVATFLYAYKSDWSYELCLVTGSILCATDPVAVVALLKDLGASPMLTVQIQGESLLNDGTAYVMYLVAYYSISGVDASGDKWDPDVPGVLMFLVKTAGMAWALGMFIGYFFFGWIRIASNRLNHSSSMIQISLTICCAYWSFVLAEVITTRAAHTLS
jgi:NhaP-type Na+/H+ or K+/H+ antiporter